ncbi:acid protease [Mycena rebaudengoi]|nr:acid protease [Mycena rebaudengoi]
MQLPIAFFALAAAAILTLSPANARPMKLKRTNRMVTLPVRRVENNGHLHVEMRHQHHINRAERLLARAAGVPEPSEVQLRANLERRALHIQSKRFNIPDFIPPAPESELSSLAVDNDDDDKDNNASDSPKKFSPGSSQIDIDGVDTTYVAVVQFGTPPRDFNIILDSGSGDLWVESETCANEDGGGCGNHTTIGESSSSTFVNSKKPWDITYGSGSASGDLVSDTMIIAGMVLKKHHFGIAHRQSNSFTGDTVADGLMGLGKAGLSNQKNPTPPMALFKAGLIDAPITTYRLPRLIDNANNGVVTFGGLDENTFDPKTLVTLKATDSDFWILNMAGVSVNGDDIKITGKTALMDTGTTLLVVPAKDAAAIHAKIPGAKLTDSGQYSVPCNTKASVAISFGDATFAIDPKDLPFASQGRKTGDCQSGIASTDTDNVGQWLVGDTFLKAVVFSHNEQTNEIKLAKAI